MIMIIIITNTVCIPLFLDKEVGDVTKRKLSRDVFFATENHLEKKDRRSMPLRVEGGEGYRGVPRRSRLLRRTLAVAAGCLLMGSTVACAAQDASEVAENRAGVTVPVTATAVPPPSPAVLSLLEPKALGQADTELPPASGTAVAPVAESPAGGGLARQDGEEPEPEPSFLHADVDGDNAVIISSPQEDAAQAPSDQHGESSHVHQPSKGATFIWHDGDRQATIWQDTRLKVSDVLPEGGWGDPSGPVFWSESNELMALSGGVILMLDTTWDAAAIAAFMSSNSIDLSDAQAFQGLINAFKVETDPGFPSLLLANSLAGQGGVIISSPNWWVQRFVE